MEATKTRILEEWALKYASIGLYVIPLHEPLFNDNGKCIGCTCEAWKRTQPKYGIDYICRTPGKHPIHSEWEATSTTDPETITNWWTWKPTANIGICPGPSGKVCLDGDKYKAGGGDWRIGETVTSLTGGGGEHWIYDHPTDSPKLGNGTGDLPDWIDVRGHGGMFVAPPSLHPSGNHYEWETGYSPFEIEPAPLPDDIRNILIAAIKPEAPQLEWVCSEVTEEQKSADLALLAKTREARNGNKFSQLFDDGKIDDYDNDHSRADAALCSLFAFRTKDHMQIDRLFRQSALMRPKWDEKRRTSTYGAVTISYALSKQTDTYSEPLASKNGRGPKQPQFDNKSVPINSGYAVAPVSLTEDLELVNLDFLKQCLYREELGDGELIAEIYADRIRYDHSARRWGDGWYLWIGHYWGYDATALIRLLYSSQCADQYFRGAGLLTKQTTDLEERAENEPDEDKKKELKKAQKKTQDLANAMVKRTKALRKIQRSNNALRYAASKLSVTADFWDTKHLLFGVANGVINLEAGELEPGKPVDYIRTVSPILWEGLDAPAPRFQRFILEIMGHDEDMAAFLQRIFGYGISGQTTEHIFPIFWGADGRNGKDTLLESVGHVLGPMAGTVSKSVVIKGRRPNGGAASPDIAALQGKRLVWVPEPDEGAVIDAGQVKLFTGGGRIRARNLFENEVEFEATHLPILVTNPKPRLAADDNALWERVLLIPFDQRFLTNPAPNNPNEHKADKNLKDKLREEAPGILAWLVRGFLAWQHEGLNPPRKVIAATKAYRKEEDTIALFMGDSCITGDGYTVRASAFYKSYAEWCHSNNIEPITGTDFGRKVTKRFDKKKEIRGLCYHGVGLLDDDFD